MLRCELKACTTQAFPYAKQPALLTDVKLCVSPATCPRLCSHVGRSHVLGDGCGGLQHSVTPQRRGAQRGRLVLQPVVHKALLQGLQAGECPHGELVCPQGWELSSFVPLQNQEIAEQLLYMLSKSVMLEELVLENSGLRG